MNSVRCSCSRGAGAPIGYQVRRPLQRRRPDDAEQRLQRDPCSVDDPPDSPPGRVVACPGSDEVGESLPPCRWRSQVPELLGDAGPPCGRSARGPARAGRSATCSTRWRAACAPRRACAGRWRASARVGHAGASPPARRACRGGACSRGPRSRTTPGRAGPPVPGGRRRAPSRGRGWPGPWERTRRSDPPRRWRLRGRVRPAAASAGQAAPGTGGRRTRAMYRPSREPPWLPRPPHAARPPRRHRRRSPPAHPTPMAPRGRRAGGRPAR